MIVVATLVLSEALSLPRFTKHVLDTRFVSEGVAVGDVDRDGRPDIVAGNVWYQAPDWAPQEIAPVADVDPRKAYSNCFHCWTEDVNHDGWIDQIVIGMPGEKAVWRENPKGKTGPWKEHLVWPSACNESPAFVDLLDTGKKVLVMGTNDEFVAWFEPDEDPYAPWVCHKVSPSKGPGSQRYSHGLGVGDLNGDGRKDIVTTGGAYLAPEDRRNALWTFQPASLGPDCAHMSVLDKGVLSTSAHARGVWWHQPDDKGGFSRSVIDETLSVTHAAVLTTFDKALNLVTGKRQWGHPPGVDVGSDEPAWLVRYERSGDGWVRHVIDESSGVGTQFVVQDVDKDGRLDIVTANKNGVFLFVQS